MAVWTRAPRPGAAVPRSLRTTVVGLVVLIWVNAFSAMAVTTVMPVAARELDALAYYAWPFAVFFALSVVGNVVAGRQCEAHGPRTSLVGGALMFAAGLIVAGLAPSMAVLVLGRAMQGAGSGAVGVSTLVVIAAAFPEQTRPRMFSLLSSGWVLPSIVGPPLAGMLAEYSSWRVVFLGVAPAVAPALLLLWPTLRTLAMASRGAATPIGGRGALVYAVMIAVGLSGIQLAASGAELAMLALLVPSVALLVPALPRLLPAGTLRVRRGVPAVVAFRAIVNGPYFALTAFLPLILVETYGQSTAAAAVPLAAATLGWGIGALVSARFEDGARYHLIRAACAQIALSALVLVVLSGTGGPVWPVTVLWLFTGAALGASATSIAVVLFRLSPPEQRAGNSTALQLSDAIGRVVAVGLGGLVLTVVLDRGGSVTMAMSVFLLVLAAVAAAGTVLAGRLRVPATVAGAEATAVR